MEISKVIYEGTKGTLQSDLLMKERILIYLGKQLENLNITLNSKERLVIENEEDYIFFICEDDNLHVIEYNDNKDYSIHTVYKNILNKNIQTVVEGMKEGNPTYKSITLNDEVTIKPSKDTKGFEEFVKNILEK
ncbi:hypothetical protein [Staphylococcus saprophyticus]|uniref:hypothetical protein n=1 Tax=Staphylococcus saprophyticus TaxID=29385 RepID=UPI0022EAADDB|nr:hypothetical protein [Staphylococcus saprophyticus]